MSRKRPSLRTSLFAAIALTVALSIALTLAVGTILSRRSLERSNRAELAQQADVLTARERAPGGSLYPFLHPPALPTFLRRQGWRTQVFKLSRPSPYLPSDRVAALRAGEPLQGSVQVDGKTHLYAARAIEGRGMILLRPSSLRFADWRPFFEGLLLAGLVGAVLAGLASYLFARAISRPVSRVAAASRSLAAGSSPDPVPVEGSAELSSLARSFNDMAAQLARAQAAERSFLLSVSHELKTPLTAIHGYAEGIRDRAVDTDEAVDVIALEAGRLERLVRDLLDLARLNKSEFRVQRHEVNLADVARETARRYAAQAKTWEVELEVEAEEPTAATGDADRVLQVLSNLVENALRSTPAGGAVVIRAEPGALTVGDTGRGLPAEDLARAFERFFLYDRHGGRRTVGTGLGLAIVKELTEAMDGSVEVRSQPGDGTTFVVRLPPAPARSAELPPLESREPVTSR